MSGLLRLRFPSAPTRLYLYPRLCSSTCFDAMSTYPVYQQHECVGACPLCMPCPSLYAFHCRSHFCLVRSAPALASISSGTLNTHKVNKLTKKSDNMPGLRKIVSTFRLNKDEHDEQIVLDHSSVAVPRQRGAKLQKRNTNAIGLDGSLESKSRDKMYKPEKANATRPTLAKRFIRGFTGSKRSQGGSETIVADMDAVEDLAKEDEHDAAAQFEEESRAFAALAGSLSAQRSSRMLHVEPVPSSLDVPNASWSWSEAFEMSSPGIATTSAQEYHVPGAFVSDEERTDGASPPDSAIAFPEDNLAPSSGTHKGKERAVFSDGHPWTPTPALSAAGNHANHCRERFLRTNDIRGDQAIAEQLALEEQWSRPSAGPSRTRECAVCGDHLSPLDFPARAPTPKCSHRPQTCTGCLQSWMASEFDTKGCSGITCSECTETMEYADVQRAATTVTFEAYDKMAMRNALSSLPEFAWCLGCDSGQLNPENHNYMNCASCGYKQCLKHKVKWHANETCEQFGYRTSGQQARDEERANEATLNAMSKKCPGPGCGWRIEKISGCDHMKCKRCKHEFCWQCLAAQHKIREIGNTAHKTSCKFHSTNLDVAWPFNAH